MLVASECQPVNEDVHIPYFSTKIGFQGLVQDFSFLLMHTLEAVLMT